jgi:hypothetical protein
MKSELRYSESQRNYNLEDKNLMRNVQRTWICVSGIDSEMAIY